MRVGTRVMGIVLEFPGCLPDTHLNMCIFKTGDDVLKWKVSIGNWISVAIWMSTCAQAWDPSTP